jgi:hypothetical protein
MQTDAQTVKAVEDALAKADARLQGLDGSPFSPAAFRLLKEKVGQHLHELVTESIKVSRGYQADTVSAAYVERASEYLVTSTNGRPVRHIGTVGGILLGAGLSTLLTMTIAGQFTKGGTLLSVVIGVIGAFMVALHIAKD